jgi:serine/threonine protein kinase SCH9
VTLTSFSDFHQLTDHLSHIKSIVAQKSIDHILSERKVLQRAINCRFLVGLKFSFQTEKELFFVMDYKSGGELFKHLQRDGGKFEEDRVKFYVGEILLALEFLHELNIIYRDLKPEK